MKRTCRNIFVCTVLVASIYSLTLNLPPHIISIDPSASAHSANRPLNLRSSGRGKAAIQELPKSGLYDSLRKAADMARYEARWEEAPANGAISPAYHAENPAQRLDAYFTANGLRLIPAGLRGSFASVAVRAGTDQTAATGWQATMRLIGYGYGEALVATGDGEVTAKGNRIELRRAGASITEWYVNLPEGLEQGFTLEAAPGNRIERERLRLELELTGDLHAEPAVDGDSIALARADGARSCGTASCTHMTQKEGICHRR